MTMSGESRAENAGFQALTLRIWAVTLAVLVLEFAAIMLRNHGHFTFSFDDPYIHLAMAEEILNGHYGINPHESAAAASSILYPFLLAPLLALGFGQFAALLLNVLAALGVGVMVARLLSELRLGVERLPGLSIAILAGLFGTGLISLAFSGLEHTLQVADAMACLWGLVSFLRRGRVSPWFIVALILAPLIRYEGMSLLAAGVLVLLLKREWRSAAIAGVVGFGLVAAFSAFLVHLGLPILPSSVLVKSSGAADGMQGGVVGLIRGFALTLGTNIQDTRGLLFLIGIVVAAAPFLKAAKDSSDPREWPPAAFIGLFAALVMFAHIALGAYGWFARYEIYVLYVGLFGVIAIHAERLAPILARATARDVVTASLAFAFVMVRMVAMVPATVTAANNIYEQQYQMHRFVTEVWKAPVAVNDLGYVSFKNDAYVLDLFGLGSDTARKMRRAYPNSGAWMEPLAEAHGVPLAMIFPEWLRHIPCGWVRLGDLELSGQAISVPFDHVTLYATQAGDAPDIAEKIKSFVPMLPQGVRFHFADLEHIPLRNAYCAD